MVYDLSHLCTMRLEQRDYWVDWQEKND